MANRRDQTEDMSFVRLVQDGCWASEEAEGQLPIGFRYMFGNAKRTLGALLDAAENVVAANREGRNLDGAIAALEKAINDEH